MNDRSMLVRFCLIGLATLLATTVLGARLALLHLGTSEEALAKIARMHQVQWNLLGRRGKIVEGSQGQGLWAIDLEGAHVCANPRKIVAADAVPQTSARLAEMLDLDVDAVAVRLHQPDRTYTRVKKFVRMELLQDSALEELPGVHLEDLRMRYYPQGSMACHVVGFVNHEGVGSAGVEQHYNRYLRGHAGKILGQADAFRREIYTAREVVDPAGTGHALELTIDQQIQYFVEKELDSLMAEAQAQAVWAIVQHVPTGEILAMASRPAYDLNAFQQATDTERKNRAISVNYEPGSTMKAAAFAAALNEGIVTADTVFDCENGSWFHKGRPLRDVGSYDKLTVADGLKKSSNILTAKMSLMLGNERLYAYFQAFGLGEQLGIDLPGEEAGIFAPPSRWYGVTPTRIPIGQGISATALQVLTVFSTIANDGYRMRPYVVRRVLSEDGEVVHENRPTVVQRVIRPDTAALMRHLLQRVTESDGTGRRARIADIAVAGKTGTAQKPENGGYSSSKLTSSFAGFFPADEPEIALIVVVDEPQPAHGGGRIAAPAFRRIGSEISRYMGLYGPAEMRGQLAMQEL